MSEELKPCPCGGKPTMRGETDPDMCRWSWIECISCGLRTRGKWVSDKGDQCPIFFSEVRDEWNDVMPDQPRPAETDKEKLASWMCEQGYATGHGDSMNDLLAELKGQIQPRPAVPDDWQPIETAPRDGKSILVWCPEYLCTYCVRWDELFSTWQIFGGMSLHFRPTLWTSTPEPTWAAQQPEGGDQ